MGKAFLAVFAFACIVTPFVAGSVRAQNYPSPPDNDWIFYGFSTTTQGYDEERWLSITGREVISSTMSKITECLETSIGD